MLYTIIKKQRTDIDMNLFNTFLTAADGANPAGGTGSMISMVLMIVGFIAIYYFLIHRPQKKQDAERKNLLDNLQVGDEILSVDGEKVYISSNISFLLEMNLSDDPATHDLVVLRQGQEVQLENFAMEKTLVQTERGEQLLYGMMLTTQPRTFLSGLKFAWANTMDTVRMVRLSLQMLLGGQAGINDVGGPVMIVQTVSEAAASSGSARGAILNVLSFCAFIGVNLAVMNLLPIPALDGGRAVCLLLTAGFEKLSGRKLDPKYEGYLHGAGMILLLGFMALVTFKDIFNIFRG